MQRTLYIQLVVSPEQGRAIGVTMALYTACFNAATRFGWDNHTVNGVELHKGTYATLRAQYPELPSQLVCSSRVKATESLKSVRARLAKGKKASCPLSRLQSVRYDARSYTISLTEGWATLATVAGRQRVTFDAGFTRLQTWKPTSAELVYRRNQFWLHVVVESPAPVYTATGEVVGVDLGIVRPAVTSEAQFFGERRWRNVEQRYFRLRRALQAKATRSARRKLRKLSGKQARFRRDCDHVLSRRLVESVDPGAVLVFENLTGIRDRADFGRHGNRRLHGWSFAQLFAFTAYKAEEGGKTTATVDPRGTSQKCSRCGHVARGNRVSQSEFRCQKCGFRINADLNAGRNVKGKYLVREGSAVSGGPRQPA